MYTLSHDCTLVRLATAIYMEQAVYLSLCFPLPNDTVTFCIFVYAVTVHCDQGLGRHLAR